MRVGLGRAVWGIGSQTGCTRACQPGNELAASFASKCLDLWGGWSVPETVRNVDVEMD